MEKNIYDKPEIAGILVGETWRPAVKFVERDAAGKKVPKDCTDYDSYMVLSTDNNQLSKLEIDWVDRASGRGYFDLQHESSRDFKPGEYPFEIVLYQEEPMLYKKVPKTGTIIIGRSLKPEIWMND